MWSTLQRAYYVFNYEWADPRNKDFPLMERPFTMLFISIGYLAFANKYGPALMHQYKAFELRKTMIVYNALQVVLNAWFVYQASTYWFSGNYSWTCEPVDWSLSPRAVWLANLVYYFNMLRLFDMTDTIMFVLRKKNSQISFLHKTHHFGMYVSTWVAAKFFPGGQCTMVGLLNGFAHVVMYSYYLVSSLNIPSIWWKKYVTQTQMATHCMLGLHSLQLLFSNPCGYPYIYGLLMPPLAFWVFSMFASFYSRTYLNEDLNNISRWSTNIKQFLFNNSSIHRKD